MKWKVEQTDERQVSEPALCWMRAPKAQTLLFLIFFLLYLSEIRIINFRFLGDKSLSLTDLVFIPAGLFFVVAIICSGAARLLAQKVYRARLSLLVYGMVIVAAMMFGNREVLGGGYDTYVLTGLGIYMLITYLMLSSQPIERVVSGISLFCLFSIGLLFSVYVATRWLHLPGFQYGELTPALHLPFMSPNQAGLAGILVLMLATGSLLSLRKSGHLFLVVPAMTLVIAQTGSRSAMCFLLYGWAGLTGLLYLPNRGSNRDLIIMRRHVWGSTLAAVALLFLLIDTQGLRAISMLSVSPIQFISGDADPWRATAWAGITDGTWREQGSTHNVYLDLFRVHGMVTVGAFIVFLLSLIVPVIRRLWGSRCSYLFPLYAALCVSLLALAGSLYANPLFHLRYVWAFLGLTMVLVWLGPALPNADGR